MKSSNGWVAAGCWIALLAAPCAGWAQEDEARADEPVAASAPEEAPPAEEAATAQPPVPAPESSAPGPETESPAEAPTTPEMPVIAVPQAAPAAPPALDEGPGQQQLDEIVVTAQKRVQRLVDVPINVSALGGDDVRRARLEQVRDVASYIPNVDIKEQVPGAIPVVAIRGVGLDDFSSTNSPAAGIYVDQVTLSSLALMSFDLYDIERIEVLKGPQGTLYGRNSTAGAINVLTARPGPEREGFLKAGMGSYEASELEGMFNLPLADWLAIRVAGKAIRQGQGLWRSRLERNDDPAEPAPIAGGLPALLGLPPQRIEDHARDPVKRDIGERDILLGRVRLGGDFTPYLSVDLKIEGMRQRSEMGQPEQMGTFCDTGFMPIDPDHCTDSLGYSDTDRDPYTGDWRGDFPYVIDQLGETLTIDYDLEWAELTSVTGHIDLERFFHIDVDGSPYDAFDFFQADTVDQVTQELRLAGTGDAGDWLVGVFWGKDDITVGTDGRHQDAIPGETSRIDADQETESAAAFASVDWHLTDALTLVTGLRYTSEERHYVGGSNWTVPIPGTISDTAVDDSIEDRNWSWKAGLNWAPTRTSLIYANASKGVKSGGFFSGITTNNEQLAPYRPEQLIAYEVGAKRQGALMLNASLFWYDYSDVQVFMRSATAPVQLIGNVPEARVYGLDAEAMWRGWDGLTLQVGLGMLRSRLGEFTDPSGAAAPLPVAIPGLEGEPAVVPEGNRLANAPELTVNALARYELGLFDSGAVVALQVDGHYASETFKEATNDPLLRSEPYTIYNARLSFLPSARDWDVSAWCRNLTDEQYAVQGLHVKAFYFGNHNYNAPRTAGVEVSVKF